MSRHEAIIGRGLRARTPPAQKTEARVACSVLNRMTRRTGEDEALFRLTLLDETAARDIRRVGNRRCAVSARLSGDVLRHVRHGLFEAEAAPATLVLLELRGGGAPHRLDAARLAFVGQRPRLCRA